MWTCFRALLLATLLCAQLTHIHADVSSTYMGCYMDRAEVESRALPYYQSQSKEMTVTKCLEECAARGMEYAGLQYKQECYCSRQPPRYNTLSEDRCTMDCEGQTLLGDRRKCGGALALSVYQIHDVKPPADDNRPLLCLVMILKNEGHTILDTLVTIRDHIDCWYILDTGSTDDTKEKITNFFKNVAIPGKIFEEPFVDYGATRNRILVLAKETANPVFTLMLSADERVLNPADMRAFLKEYRYAAGTQHGAYPVVMNTGVKFDSLRLARVDAGWRYRARVHEYLAPASGPYVAVYRPVPNEINVFFNVTDGDRRYKSQFFIKRILEEDLAKDPQDTRSMYYLARTNSGVGNHSEAVKYYTMLAERSKWDEEVYHGMVMKAIESKLLNPPVAWQQREAMLLEAFMYKPNSMDALHVLAQDHYDAGRPQLAYIYGLRMVNIKPPPGLVASENVLLRPTRYLYDYEGHRLLGFAARDIGEWEQCVESFQHVLTVNPKDTIVQDRLVKCQQEWEKTARVTQMTTQLPVHLDEASARKKMVEAKDARVFPPAPFIDPRGSVIPISAFVGSHHESHHHTIYQIEMEEHSLTWWITCIAILFCGGIVIMIISKRRQKKIKI